MSMMLFILFQSSVIWADGNEELGITLPEFKGKYDLGWVTLGAFGLRGDATALMKIPENAEIVAAYVYMSGYSNLTPNQLGDIMVTLSNGDTTITRAAKCIGYSKDSQKQCFTYRADATGLVSMGEHRYHVQGFTLPAQPTSGGIYGGGLVAIYSLPNLPETKILIADGLDFFDAKAGFPGTKTVVFPVEGNRFERSGNVKIFSGMNATPAASAIWYSSGNSSAQADNLIDASGAVDYNNSSSSDPAVDTDPLVKTFGNRAKWAMVEFNVPIGSEQSWVSFQLESQADKPNVPPYSGVLNMIAFTLPDEEVGAGSIGDRVFYDKNSNGTRDQMEAGIPGVLVSLYQDDGNNVLDPQADTFIDSVRTNRLGFYLFQFLKKGTYFVDIDHPYLNDTSIVLTAKSDPTGPIQVDGAALLDIDFGVNFNGQRPQRQVQLNNFSSWTDSSGVWLNWSAVVGTENMGFDVFRSMSPNGGFSLINENIIPVSNTPGNVHNYSFFDPNVDPGQTYYYQLGDVDLSGNVATYGPIAVTAGVTGVAEKPGVAGSRMDYMLGQAYPNPFNGRTNIQFTMARSGWVRLEVYNLQGQRIRTLMSEVKSAGNHVATWDGRDDLGQSVGSGLYFYKMSAPQFQTSKRIIYLK
ncbi:MAG: T9SS type A sorting domain-containing protein [candidate division KSB1 bacterium]|nr:T9SS type A sorting domain-containing protein [candidate division KSB1 bacterium]MDZ7340774.1 T9SS type A sorting domain-containing protein [candidate division KSB1 bacterium]